MQPKIPFKKICIRKDICAKSKFRIWVFPQKNPIFNFALNLFFAWSIMNNFVQPLFIEKYHELDFKWTTIIFHKLQAKKKHTYAYICSGHHTVLKSMNNYLNDALRNCGIHLWLATKNASLESEAWKPGKENAVRLCSSLNMCYPHPHIHTKWPYHACFHDAPTFLKFNFMKC